LNVATLNYLYYKSVILLKSVRKPTSKQLFYVFRAHQSFNKEVFVDFVAAQIKTLSFLAYIVRIFQVKWIDVLNNLN